MKKMVTCKTCGEKIAKSADVCPHCGEKQKRGIGCACIIIILIAVVLSVVILLNSGSETGESKNADSNAVTKEITILENGTVSVVYKDIYEDETVEGVFFLKLHVENKTDKTVWVYLDDASVNGTMTTVMSAVPMTITPGNKSNNPFIISYSLLDIDDLSEVKDISFRVNVEENETGADIFRSDILKIDF